MLRALELSDMEPIRKWRNASLDTLRTPFPLTREQQEEWYHTVICDRRSSSRFWAITNKTNLVGYGGIENIQWENRIGEISLLIDPSERGHGYGTQAARAILDEAFNRLNLYTVYAECYCNNPAIVFWGKVFENGSRVLLEDRKYCDGTYFPSYYYSLKRECA